VVRTCLGCGAEPAAYLDATATTEAPTIGTTPTPKPFHSSNLIPDRGEKTWEALPKPREVESQLLGTLAAADSKWAQVVEAERRAKAYRGAHAHWLKSDPTYPARFKEAVDRHVMTLEDRANRLAIEGVERPVLHDGKPVRIDGAILKAREWDSQMIRFLLTALNREKYGERKVIELDFTKWDGDISKLSEGAIRGIVEILRKQELLESGEGQEKAQDEPASGVPMLGTTVIEVEADKEE
jgi:hypothetical protein